MRIIARGIRVLVGALGVGVIAYGVYGLTHDSYIQHPLDVVRWAVVGLVLHDGLWLPLVAVFGALFVRGAALRGGLMVAAALTAVGLPAVLREGHDNGNNTLLQLPYRHNLLVVLGVVGALTLVAALAELWHHLSAKPARAGSHARPRAAIPAGPQAASAAEPHGAPHAGPQPAPRPQQGPPQPQRPAATQARPPYPAPPARGPQPPPRPGPEPGQPPPAQDPTRRDVPPRSSQYPQGPPYPPGPQRPPDGPRQGPAR